jgi:DNA-directed RNA polymerase subunit N (RpoN/RPB10)
MNNNCLICKKTISEEWSSLQNTIKETADLNNPLVNGFVERCIYCYKDLLELTEKRDHEWYIEVMKAVEKRFRW